MTKKYLIRLAANLKLTKPDRILYNDHEDYTQALVAWNIMVSNIADMCAEMNDMFKRVTFYNACGYGE